MYLSFDINKFLWCEIEAVLVVHTIHQKGNEHCLVANLATLILHCIAWVSQKYVTDATRLKQQPYDIEM